MFSEVDLSTNRDMNLNYDKELESAKKHDCVPVESNHPLLVSYILLVIHYYLKLKLFFLDIFYIRVVPQDNPKDRS